MDNKHINRIAPFSNRVPFDRNHPLTRLKNRKTGVNRSFTKEMLKFGMFHDTSLLAATKSKKRNELRLRKNRMSMNRLAADFEKQADHIARLQYKLYRIQEDMLHDLPNYEEAVLIQKTYRGYRAREFYQNYRECYQEAGAFLTANLFASCEDDADDTDSHNQKEPTFLTTGDCQRSADVRAVSAASMASSNDYGEDSFDDYQSRVATALAQERDVDTEASSVTQKGSEKVKDRVVSELTPSVVLDTASRDVRALSAASMASSNDYGEDSFDDYQSRVATALAQERDVDTDRVSESEKNQASVVSSLALQLALGAAIKDCPEGTLEDNKADVMTSIVNLELPVSSRSQEAGAVSTGDGGSGSGNVPRSRPSTAGSAYYSGDDSYYDDDFEDFAVEEEEEVRAATLPASPKPSSSSPRKRGRVIR